MVEKVRKIIKKKKKKNKKNERNERGTAYRLTGWDDFFADGLQLRVRVFEASLDSLGLSCDLM